jgi:hypothetical protein
LGVNFGDLYATTKFYISDEDSGEMIDGGERMSNVRSATFTCPICSFSIQTPFGPEDAAEHVKLHADKHHNDKVARARISKSELIKLQKK